ncbi:hypothetical protein JEODO184_00274 [Jeotgalicoccus meleagridis]|uniref:N6 adenine-specific DNA methyltransferase N-terminal domain-containing protein n=1 Tax=Jeotgalicoccus meleagridis TaxID=2759181 RepID=A0A6V7R364_9STAP|nr:hypothetical protein JEODO184_00274 [Jeotgalicoccus meleagridis]
MDASEYKSVVLGLIFLKYVSDAFEEKNAELIQDEHMAENIFWVPKEARWTYINENSKKPEIVQLISNGVKKHNKAAIMVTHDERMLEYCDRVFQMNDGKLEQVIDY